MECNRNLHKGFTKHIYVHAAGKRRNYYTHVCIHPSYLCNRYVVLNDQDFSRNHHCGDKEHQDSTTSMEFQERQCICSEYTYKQSKDCMKHADYYCIDEISAKRSHLKYFWKVLGMPSIMRKPSRWSMYGFRSILEGCKEHPCKGEDHYYSPYSQNYKGDDIHNSLFLLETLHSSPPQ